MPSSHVYDPSAPCGMIAECSGNVHGMQMAEMLPPQPAAQRRTVTEALMSHRAHGSVGALPSTQHPSVLANPVATWGGAVVVMPAPSSVPQCHICRRMPSEHFVRCGFCEQFTCQSCVFRCAACEGFACRFCSTIRYTWCSCSVCLS